MSLRRWLPYAILLAEVLLFHRRVLFQEGYVIPWDFRYFHYPHQALIADSLSRGEPPLWDPYTHCGRPLFANIQAAVFYPPLAAVNLLSTFTGHQFYLLELLLIGHIWLAGGFAYALLRRLGVSVPAALLGATVFQLGGFFAARTQHLGPVCTAAWTPLAWLAVMKLREGWRARRLALLAFALSMSVLAGFPAGAFVAMGSSLLLAAMLAVFRLAPARLLGTVLAGIAWSLALAAVQLLPTLQLSGLSVAQYRTDWLGGGGGLPLAALVSLAVPNYYGIFDLKRYAQPWQPTELYLYCGALVGLLLAAAALARRTRQMVLFAVFAFICALWMLGESTPVGQAAYWLLPGFVRNALHPEFAAPAFLLALAVLAGLGAQAWLRRPLLGWLAVGITAVDLTLVGSGRPMNTASTREEPGVTPEQFEGSRETLERIRWLCRRDYPPARIDTLDASTSWAVTAPLTRVPTSNGYDPLTLVRTMQVRLAFAQGERWGAYYHVTDLESPVLDLVGARYLLSRRLLDPARAARAGLVHVADLATERVYENHQVLPRFFLVGRVRRAGSLEEAVQRLRAREFDPRAEAIVEYRGTGVQPVQAGSFGPVRVLEYSAQRVVLEVEASAPAFLVTSETHYPGWRGRVDGVERAVFYTNIAFRGLPVPAGRHRVEFEFLPAILPLSAALSAAACLPIAFCLLPLAFPSGRSRRLPVANAPPALLP